MKPVLLLFAGVVIATRLAFAGPGPAIDGWFVAGSNPKDYDAGKDMKVYHKGKSSAFLQSNKESVEGFGTLMQLIKADSYRGKRVRMTGYVKVDNIKGSAQMWMRVDSKDLTPQQLRFDNMSDRAITAPTDWKKCDIVLDVPVNSGAIAFGVLLNGTGKLWFDDVQIVTVNLSVPTTDSKMAPKYPAEPVNPGFEK